MSKQYNFMDVQYFNKDEKDKDIFHQTQTCSSPLDAQKQTQKGILDPDFSTIKIKDIEKGV